MVGRRDRLEVAGHSVGLAHLGGTGDDGGELPEVGQQLLLRGVGEQRGVETGAVHARLDGVARGGAGAGMGVLDIEDRVVVGLRPQQLRVDVDRRVRGEAGQRVAQSIGPQPGDQVGQLDDVSGALGELGSLDAHQLADEDLDVAVGVVPGTGGDGLEPDHVAMVVRPEQVDLLLEAALPLREVVGGVGGEVGRLTVGLEQHAILVIAEVGGAQPDGAVAVLDMALAAQRLHRCGHFAVIVEGLLGEVDVEVHAELRKGVLDLPELRLVGELSDDGQGLLPRQVHQVGARREGLLGQLLSVLPRVAALGDGFPVETRQHRGREDVHLVAGVVDVVLAGDLGAGGTQQAGERVSQGRPSGVAQVQGPGGVR